MNSSFGSDESIDIEQMVDAFENMLQILEVSSLSEILDSERIENASNELSDPKLHSITAFEGKIMVNDESNYEKSSELIGNSHSVQKNTAGEFHHENNQSIENPMNTDLDIDTNETYVETINEDVQMMEGSDLNEISNIFVRNPSNADQQSAVGVNIGENEARNTIDSHSNTMHSEDTSVLYATSLMKPMRNCISQQLDRNCIDLVTSVNKDENFNDGTPNASKKTRRNTRNDQRKHKLLCSEEIECRKRRCTNNRKTPRKGALKKRNRFKGKTNVC